MDSPPGDKSNQAPVRRYPRMIADCVVAYRRLLPDGSESAPQFSRTHSVGLGGLMFETEVPLELGEFLRLEIVLGEHTVRAVGQVAYVDRRDDQTFQNGVQFSEISEDDRDRLLSVYLQREYRITPT